MGQIFLWIIGVIVMFIILGCAFSKGNQQIEADYNDNFRPTEIVAGNYGLTRYIEVDLNNKRWRINKTTSNSPTIHEYEDLRDFELLETGQGSYTRASTTPSILFGDVVKETYAKTDEYADIKIRVSFKDLSVADQYLSFGKNVRGSAAYNMAFNDAQKCLSLLRKIKAYNEENNLSNDSEREIEDKSSVADELIKLKSLLDSGVITQEEFNTQKQKLL